MEYDKMYLRKQWNTGVVLAVKKILGHIFFEISGQFQD
jgi:hypothetical protein